MKKWQKDNRDKRNEYYREQRRISPKHRLNHSISTAINYSLKGNKNGYHWEDLVGYTLQDLMIHLENLFKNEMNWNNYGKWHLDHIIPKNLFKYENPKDPEFKECWALENLQPLWAEDNLKKAKSLRNKNVNN